MIKLINCILPLDDNLEYFPQNSPQQKWCIYTRLFVMQEPESIFTRKVRCGTRIRKKSPNNANCKWIEYRPQKCSLYYLSSADSSSELWNGKQKKNLSMINDVKTKWRRHRTQDKNTLRENLITLSCLTLKVLFNRCRCLFFYTNLVESKGIFTRETIRTSCYVLFVRICGLFF